MKIAKNIHKGIKVLKRLISSYQEGIFFELKKLPHEILPNDVKKGDNSHLLFLTYISAIDYKRIQERLWDAGRQTFNDQKTKYLFSPEKVVSTPIPEIKRDLEKYKVLLNPLILMKWKIRNIKVDRRNTREDDIGIWITLSNVLMTYNCNVEKLLSDFNYDVLKLIDVFTIGQYKNCFPNYRKRMKVILWLKRINEISRFRLKNFNKLEVPVDTHIIRATFMTGSISGEVDSYYEDIEKLVSDYWIEVSLSSKEQIDLSPIEFETFLWLLSKHGCSKKHENGICPMFEICPVKDLCSKGIVKVFDKYIKIDV